MSTNPFSPLPQGSQISHPLSTTTWTETGWMSYLVLAGRAIYAAIFIMAAPGHFTKESIGYAAQAGVPLAEILVPLSGVISVVGGPCILVGYHTRIGAWLLVLFLVPVTVMMHNFWTALDPMMARMQGAMFMKNISMLGGSLLIAYFGAGPLSLDARRHT